MTMRFLILYFFILVSISKSEDSNDFQISADEALEFLPRFRRSFLHPGKTKCEEQKREARKAYEEKCSILGKRFCPKLSEWKDFDRWEIGGGYESQRNPLPTQKSVSPVPTLATHRTRLHTMATMRTHRTPMFGPVTQQAPHRSTVYKQEQMEFV